MSEGAESGAERQGAEPGEEELRRALEEQMRNIRVEELLVQSVVSLINLSARRVAIEEERDLAQARLGIESVRALLGLLPDDIAEQIRQALSQLQLQYAQLAGGEATGGQAAGGGGAEGQGTRPANEPGQAPTDGPQAARSKLWTPPGTA